jgi:murein DD-endopeptidase MepM/ murein hydrolase activator NlpD
MKFIIVDNQSGRSRAFTVNSFILGVTLAGLIGLPAAASYISYRLGLDEAAMIGDMVGNWRQVLKDQEQSIALARRDAQENVEASAVRLAKLQSRIVRLDALGERLTTIVKLDEGEFDFSQPPAVGGPESDDQNAAFSMPDYMTVLSRLSDEIESREQQLSVLETLLVDRKTQDDVFLAGRPVTKGWMSSRYGRRTDPFKGHVAWHNGVDFAGKLGSDVVSVAAGVVTWSGERSGYGQMVEVNHGNGFTTRYAHNTENIVKVGDVIKKGQVVSLMGSSGRSTGPHVHFEVYKNGRAVDPASYIHRTNR